METPLDVLSRAASLVHADDEKRKSETLFSISWIQMFMFALCISLGVGFAHFCSFLNLIM